ncbi:MAG: divalent cation tolerance protein CutA [Burkholderiales bacterium]|nr:divalent cation tolerance protein CutA [Burkholderiales bacterium]GIK86019.1 MAG: divalent cation tolerance protein [Betaproteobacteria bacterium]
MNYVLVHTTLPDEDTARALARALVGSRLAACVTIGTPVESLYHWQGAIENAREVPLTAKTRADRFADVAAAIAAQHPYELPEILAVPIVDGSADYLAWIDAAVGPR